MSESLNINMSSRGIMKCCDVYSITPISSIKVLHDYKKFKQNERIHTIYVCSSALNHFITVALPTIHTRFILVSGDCDETMPYDLFKTQKEFNDFVKNPNIVHWFCQNWVGNHPKVTLMPIGLDYHTMSSNTTDWGTITPPDIQETLLSEVYKKSSPFYERDISCYANFQFLTTTRYGNDRIDAINKINKDLVFYEENKIPRLNTWINQTNHAFVISPHGNGLDCHRTWEALALGCIPIVKTSAIDNLYKNLPVLIVNDWSDVTKEKLLETITVFKNTRFNYNKLKLHYWKNLINKYKYIVNK